MQKQLNRTKTMVTVALLIAITIVIARFLSIQTPIIRISFSFIPKSLCSMLFGPYLGAVSAFLADFLGMIINSKGMTYFFGYGISEALYGLSYGFFLHNRKKSYPAIILCVILQSLIIDIGLGSLWSVILFEKAFWAVVSTKAIRALIMAPVYIFGIKFTWEFIGKRLDV